MSKSKDHKHVWHSNGYCECGIHISSLKPIAKNTDVSFDDYNNYCTECPDHDKCHKNGEIDYDKVAKCKSETLRLFSEREEA